MASTFGWPEQRKPIHPNMIYSPESEETNSPKDEETNSPEDEETNSPKDEGTNSPEDEETNFPEDEETNSSWVPFPESLSIDFSP